MAEKAFHLREKVAELEKIEQYLQETEIDLEQAIAKHQQAIEISKEILAYLEKVESSLKQVEIKAGK